MLQQIADKARSAVPKATVGSVLKRWQAAKGGVLKHRDQGPYRHEDEEQYQDHDDQGYEGATAHATALSELASIWRSILAAGQRCCQRSELVRVEHPALRRGRPVFGEPTTEGVKLLDLLGDEPYHRVGVGA
jgi:hypothetical protein